MRQLLSDNAEARQQWLPLKQHSKYSSPVPFGSPFIILRTCTSNQMKTVTWERCADHPQKSKANVCTEPERE